MSMKNCILIQRGRWGSQIARQKQTLSQEDELSKILHVKEKRLRITINSNRKEERFIHFSTSIYSASIYQALRLEVLNKTKLVVLMELTLTPQWGSGIKYIAFYTVLSARKKNSEWQGVLRGVSNKGYLMRQHLSASGLVCFTVHLMD